MDYIKLSIELLVHQWADLKLTSINQEKMFYFEKVPNDPLYELLENTIKLFGKTDSTIKFHNGSQVEYLFIKYLDKDSCCVETESVRLVLPIKQFSKAVFRMFDTYVFTFSCEEYCTHWSMFPKKEVERLRDLYHSL